MTTNQSPTNHTLTAKAAAASVVLVSPSMSSSSSSSSPTSRPATKNKKTNNKRRTMTTPSSNHHPHHPKTNEGLRKNKKGSRTCCKKKNHKRAVDTTTGTAAATTGSTTGTGAAAVGSSSTSIPTAIDVATTSPDCYYGNDGTGRPTTTTTTTTAAQGGSSDLVTVHSCQGVPFEIHAVLGHGYYHHYNTMDSSSPPPPETQEQHCAVVYTRFLPHCGNHPVAATATAATATYTDVEAPTTHHRPTANGGGWPEFIVFDVPLEKIDPLRNLLCFLVQQMQESRFVRGGEIVESDGLVLETSWIVDPMLRWQLHQRFPFLTHTATTTTTSTTSSSSSSLPQQYHYHKLLNLKPRFPLEENQLQGYYTSQREWVASTLWGCRPPAPGGHTALRDAIVDLLTTQLIIPSRFVPWYIDGNPHNDGPANLQAVSIGEALAHPTWYVDWWGFLDGNLDMISYVRMNLKHFANIFRHRNGSKVFTEFDFHRIRFLLPTPNDHENEGVPVVIPPSHTAAPPSSPTDRSHTPHPRTPTSLHDKTNKCPPSSTTTTTPVTYRSSTTSTPTLDPCSPECTTPVVVGGIHHQHHHPRHSRSISGRRPKNRPSPPALVTPSSSNKNSPSSTKDRGERRRKADLPAVDKKAPDSPPFS